MKKNACIICAKEKDGLEVKNDWVIDTAKWIKKNIFRAEPKNYRLVVCKDDFLAYKKKRDGYERKRLIYVALGLIFMFLLLLFARGRYLGAIFYGLIILVFLYLLAQLSYVPAVALPDVNSAQKRRTKAI